MSETGASNCGDLGPCQHGGTCTFVNFCSCPLDWMGPLCNSFIGEASNPCRDVVCANSGICLVDTPSMEARCV